MHENAILTIVGSTPTPPLQERYEKNNNSHKLSNNDVLARIYWRSSLDKGIHMKIEIKINSKALFAIVAIAFSSIFIALALSEGFWIK